MRQSARFAVISSSLNVGQEHPIFNISRSRAFDNVKQLSWSIAMHVMASTKVTTVFVNQTREALILKVGNPNCSAKLATIGLGDEHKVEFDVNWTYQEFSLEPVKVGVLKKIIVDSDDCCDFEHIIVTESGGKFQVDKIARGQFNTRVPLINNWRTYFWSKFKWRFWQ